MQGNCLQHPQPRAGPPMRQLTTGQCVLTTDGGVFEIKTFGQKLLLSNLYIRASSGPQNEVYSVMVFAAQLEGAVWVEDVVFQGNWWNGTGGVWIGLWTGGSPAASLHFEGECAHSIAPP
jgi:hypothetical protein